MFTTHLGQAFDHMALSIFQEGLQELGVDLKAGCVLGVWYVEVTYRLTQEKLCGTGPNITDAIFDAIWHQESTEKAE